MMHQALSQSLRSVVTTNLLSIAKQCICAWHCFYQTSPYALATHNVLYPKVKPRAKWSKSKLSYFYLSFSWKKGEQNPTPSPDMDKAILPAPPKMQFPAEKIYFGSQFQSTVIGKAELMAASVHGGEGENSTLWWTEKQKMKLGQSRLGYNLPVVTCCSLLGPVRTTS